MQHIEITEHDFDALRINWKRLKWKTMDIFRQRKTFLIILKKIQKDITCICFGIANISRSLRQRKKKRF